MVQIAISFSVLVSKSSFPIIDIVIGFEINACQTELLVSNLNEQFRTALEFSNIAQQQLLQIKCLHHLKTFPLSVCNLICLRRIYCSTYKKLFPATTTGRIWGNIAMVTKEHGNMVTGNMATAF